MSILARIIFLLIATMEVLAVWIGASVWVDSKIGGAAVTLWAIGALWIAVLGLTPLINFFFTVIPDNSGAVLTNVFTSYGLSKDPTRLHRTWALREVGPKLQGLLPGEHVWKVIDLGKQIILDEKLTATTADNVPLTLRWVMILTPLPGYLINLVRHDEDTVKQYFTVRARNFITALVSREYALPIRPDGTIGQTIYQRIDVLKGDFKGFLKGPNGISDEEIQMGTFTNSPEMFDPQRSDPVIKAAEGSAINQMNAASIKLLTDQGISANAALIATLAAQGTTPPQGLQDITFNGEIIGLENMQHFNMGAGIIRPQQAQQQRAQGRQNRRGQQNPPQNPPATPAPTTPPTP